jgi:hypothetical protein
MTRQVANDLLALLGRAGHAATGHVGNGLAPPVFRLTHPRHHRRLMTPRAELLHERPRRIVGQPDAIELGLDRRGRVDA